jgi:hypothetical protein
MASCADTVVSVFRSSAAAVVNDKLSTAIALSSEETVGGTAERGTPTGDTRSPAVNLTLLHVKARAQGESKRRWLSSEPSSPKFLTKFTLLTGGTLAKSLVGRVISRSQSASET